MGLVYLYCLVCCCCSNGHLPSFTLEESSCGTEENILDLGQGWSSTLSLMSYVTLTSLLQVSVSSSANWNNNFDLRVPSRIKRNDACWVLHSARNLILHVSFPTLSVLERSAFKKKNGGMSWTQRDESATMDYQIRARERMGLLAHLLLFIRPPLPWASSELKNQSQKTWGSPLSNLSPDRLFSPS